jgi:hypothetical protein
MTPDFDELLRHREGETTQARAREIERHLEESAEVQARARRVDALCDALARPAPGLEAIDLRPQLALELSQRPDRPTPPWRPLALAAAAVVLLAVPLAVLFKPMGHTGLTAKGAPGIAVGLDVWSLSHGVPQPVGHTLARGTPLGFAYRNLPDSGLDYVMVFAVDSHGRVFWFYPEWTEPAADPQSVRIAHGSLTAGLPDAVQHGLEPGRLVLHGLFTPRPLRVSEVEAALASSGGVGALSGSVDRQIEVMVTP